MDMSQGLPNTSDLEDVREDPVLINDVPDEEATTKYRMSSQNCRPRDFQMVLVALNFGAGRLFTVGYIIGELKIRTPENTNRQRNDEFVDGDGNLWKFQNPTKGYHQSQQILWKPIPSNRRVVIYENDNIDQAYFTHESADVLKEYGLTPMTVKPVQSGDSWVIAAEDL